MAAFRLAVEMAADGIELDVHQTADGKLVVIHDNALDRVAGSTLRIAQAGADELRAFDVGAWFTGPSGVRFEGERIPLLAEVLTLAAEAGLWVNVELKAGSRLYPGIEAATVRSVLEHGLAERAIISSFDHYALRAVKRENTQIRTGILHASSLIDAHEYAGIVGADALHPHLLVIDPQYMAGARSLAMEVNAWTVNDPAAARTLAALGVDSLITDDPAAIRAALEATDG